MSNKTILANTDPDKVVSGVEHSDASLQGGSRKATAEELALALEASQRELAELKAKAAQNQGSDSLAQLTNLLTQALAPKQQQIVSADADNINRVTDFRNQRATIDGAGMVEAQQTLSIFRDEDTMPISIPKAMANAVGSNLDITVNGVRVSIPCDGKVHFVNKTHYEHARERLAKLDILNSQTEPQIIEIS